MNFTPLTICLFKQTYVFPEIIVGEIIGKSPYEFCRRPLALRSEAATPD